MDKRTEAFLDGPDGPFDLANMAVGGDNVKMDGWKNRAGTVKFLIPVDVVDNKTTCRIKFNNGGKFA
jgi:hypothetical protein